MKAQVERKNYYVLKDHVEILFLANVARIYFLSLFPSLSFVSRLEPIQAVHIERCPAKLLDSSPFLEISQTFHETRQTRLSLTVADKMLLHARISFHVQQLNILIKLHPYLHCAFGTAPSWYQIDFIRYTNFNMYFYTTLTINENDEEHMTLKGLSSAIRLLSILDVS